METGTVSRMNDTLMPLEELTVIIRKRRIKAMRYRDAVNYAVNSLCILLIMAATVWIFSLRFTFRIVQGNDMFPALSDGDLILCSPKSAYVRNDIVCYTVDGQTYIGRVAAVGGDTVRMTDSGTFMVNGLNTAGEIIYPTYAPDKRDTEITVPEDMFFILGDFRTQAVDSRTLGSIPQTDICDKVILLVRHRKF